MSLAYLLRSLGSLFFDSVYSGCTNMTLVRCACEEFPVRLSTLKSSLSITTIAGILFAISKGQNVANR